MVQLTVTAWLSSLVLIEEMSRTLLAKSLQVLDIWNHAVQVLIQALLHDLGQIAWPVWASFSCVAKSASKNGNPTALLLWGLNERMHVKHLVHNLSHKYHYYTIIIYLCLLQLGKLVEPSTHLYASGLQTSSTCPSHEQDAFISRNIVVSFSLWFLTIMLSLIPFGSQGLMTVGLCPLWLFCLHLFGGKADILP